MANLRLWLAAVTESEFPTWLKDDNKVASGSLVITIADTCDALAIILVQQLLLCIYFFNAAEERDQFGRLVSYVIELQSSLLYRPVVAHD